MTCSRLSILDLFMICLWLANDLFMANSWPADDFVFSTYSWLVLDFLMTCSLLPITNSWLSSLDLSITWLSCIHAFFVSCSWLSSHELFITWSKLVKCFFMTCSWLLHYLLMTYSWLITWSLLVQNLFINCLFMTCPCLFHNLFTIFSWLVYNSRWAWHSSVPSFIYTLSRWSQLGQVLSICIPVYMWTKWWTCWRTRSKSQQLSGLS